MADTDGGDSTNVSLRSSGLAGLRLVLKSSSTYLKKLCSNRARQTKMVTSGTRAQAQTLEEGGADTDERNKSVWSSDCDGSENIFVIELDIPKTHYFQIDPTITDREEGVRLKLRAHGSGCATADPR